MTSYRSTPSPRVPVLFRYSAPLFVEPIGFGQVNARCSNRGISIVFVRDTALHAKQRRTWDKDFSGSTLKDYEQLLIERTQELLENLESRTRLGESVDMSRRMKYFSRDPIRFHMGHVRITI